MLDPLGPGPEDNVEAGSGLDERLRDAVAREQTFRVRRLMKLIMSWQRKPRNEGRRCSGTDRLHRHRRTLQDARAVSTLVSCLHHWPRSLRPACDEKRVWERHAGGRSPLRVLVEPISGERWWKQTTMMVIRLTVSGRARQSCVDESHEMGGFSPTCFKAWATVNETSQPLTKS